MEAWAQPPPQQKQQQQKFEYEKSAAKGTFVHRRNTPTHVFTDIHANLTKKKMVNTKSTETELEQRRK